MTLIRLTAAVGLIGLALALAATWQADWTIDEPVQLSWSQRLLDLGVGERTSQARYMSKTPVVIPNVLALRAVQRLGVESQRLQRAVARLPTVATYVALLVAVFVFTRRHLGPRAACYATIATALEPSIIAHSTVTTVDTLYALATLLFVWAAVEFALNPSPGWGGALGAALGLAFAAKFTAVLLLPTLLLLAWFVARRGPIAWGRLAAAGSAALVSAWFVVSAAYLFRELGTPWRDVPWQTPAMKAAAAAVPQMRLPVPSAFLTGIDNSVAHERQAWNVVILGRHYTDGVWYYFLVVALLKTPLLLLAATVAGLVRFVRRIDSDRTRALLWIGSANVLLPWLYFSLAFHTQLGYRYVLMCIPLLFVMAAGGWASCTGRFHRPAAIGILLFTLAEHGLYVGNPLAFTNAAVWPKKEVFRLLADSNVDWGQNRERIKEWLKRPPFSDAYLDPVHVLPGRNVFSLNSLAGLWNFEQHRWVREHLDPLGHLGHTYLHFEVSYATFERFLDDERRLAPDGDGSCAAAAGWTRLPPGSRPTLSNDVNPVSGERWSACFSAGKTTDVGFKLLVGRVNFCVSKPDGRCELLQAGQVCWYRLEPGLHRFVIREGPNRRAWLPYLCEGQWVIRGHGVDYRLQREQDPVSGESRPPGGRPLPEDPTAAPSR